MKISKVSLVIILIISIMATACTSTPKNTDSEEFKATQSKEVEPIKATEDETIRKTREKIVDPFLEKLPFSYVTAKDIGIYIRENIANASSDEADKMFEWLLIYQNETKDSFMYAIEGEDQAMAFNNDMGGTFDKSKLDNIQNGFIKEVYTNLIYSFLIPENYIDYFYIDINWKDLAEYSSYLSDDFRKIIEIKKKIYNSEYDSYQLDIDGFSKDIITVEEILKNKNSTFIQMKADELYRSLLSHLLVGPEASYIYHYEEKNSKEYKSLMELKSKYPKSILKEIIQDIDLIGVKEIEDIIDTINKNIPFGLNFDNYIEKNLIKKKNGRYEVIQVKMPSNIEKQNRINNIIRLDTEAFIQNLGDDKSLESEMESYFQNDRYILYSGFIKVVDSNENYEYLNIYRALDYVDERYVTLEDYLDVDFIFIQDLVEELTQVKIESLPEFIVLDTGIDLYLNESTDIGKSIFLNNIDLLEYFTFEELMGNK